MEVFMHRQVPILTTLDKVWFQATLLRQCMCPIWVGASWNASCGSCTRYAGSADNIIIGDLLAITNGEITEWNLYGLRFDLQKITETRRVRDKPSCPN